VDAEMMGTLRFAHPVQFHKNDRLNFLFFLTGVQE
jgi:hypothetical protein